MAGMTKPAPERIAIALARNWLEDVRRYPREVLIDVLLLGFAVLMIFGFQLQIVRGAVEEFSNELQFLVDNLPNVAALAALFFTISNPLLQRSAARGNWLTTLPIAETTHAKWAIRRAVYGGLLISAACTIILLDILWLETRVVRIETATALNVWVQPALTVLLTGVFRWRKLLQIEESARRAARNVARSSLQVWISERFKNPLARALSYFGLAQHSARKLWVMLGGAGLVVAGMITLAMTTKQPQLLVIGAFVLPVVMGTTFEGDSRQIYRLSRALPLRFTKLIRGHVTWNLALPGLCALPFALAAFFTIEPVETAGAALLAICGATVGQFFRILIALAFPLSRIRQTLFVLGAVMTIAVVSMQAPLVAPILGAVLGAGWLFERGHGVWEFGFDNESGQ